MTIVSKKWPLEAKWKTWFDPEDSQPSQSLDDKIHITYHPSVSGRHDLTTGMSDKTLSVTDKQAS